MATTVAFGSNVIVDEETGIAWLQVNRTGDLTGTTAVTIFEDWNRGNTNADDIAFSAANAGSNITYLTSSKSLLLSFAPGVKSIRIPYIIKNDNVEESAERLYFSLVGASTGTTIGDNDANIKINASDPVLSIHGGLLVEEGNYSSSYIELSRAVDFDVAVKVSTYYGTYKEANYRGEGKDYEGLTDRLVIISAGQTKVYVPFLTLQNADPVDWLYESTEIRIEASSVPVGVLLGQFSDVVTIMDKAIVPPVVPPTLTLYDGGLVYENESTHSYAKLSHVVDYDVTFKVSTYFDTYQQANYLGESKDYEDLLNKVFTIFAGTDRAEIPVKIFQNLDPNDWEYEAFELRIELPTVYGATLDVGSAIINIKDVSTWTVTPLSADMLVNHKQAFLNLETEVGTSSAVAIIAGNKELSNVGKTLDAFDLLSSSVKNAITWFAGSTAYANKEELPTSALTEKQINIGLRLMSPMNPDDIFAPDPIEWTSVEVEETGWLGLRAGDYVDGRLVIHQPWMALDSGGSYISTSSAQGRYTSNDPSMFSHKTDFTNSMDWSALSGMLMVAPASGEIIDSEHMLSSNTGVYGAGNLGNFVTVKLDKTTLDGKFIYITYGHLEQETSQLFKAGDKVVVGQIIGSVGDTGGYLKNDVFQHYDRHAHITTGTEKREAIGGDGIKGDVADGNIDSVPPVYILGFNKNNTGSFSELGITGGGTQDYGMPIGDYDASYGDTQKVASNILPTIPISDFYIANPTFTNVNVEQGDSGDNHFTGDPGDDMYLGKGGYDQVDYFGPTSNRSNFTVTQNPDGTIKVVSAEFGTDTLNNVEGVWFDNQFKWYTIENLLNPIKTYFTTTSKPVLEGTSAEEIFIGDDNVNWFIGNGGGDTYNGHGEYDQVEYYGPNAYRSNFTFSKNLDNSVSVTSPYGAETYNSIEGVYFGTEEKWYAVDSLIFI